MSFPRQSGSYHVIKCKKSSRQELTSNPKQKYSAGFRIDLDYGIYLVNNSWCIDAKYWFKNELYSIAIDSVLNIRVEAVIFYNILLREVHLNHSFIQKVMLFIVIIYIYIGLQKLRKVYVGMQPITHIIG